jgi:Holliday junction resolvase RusA-like endonuclease
LIRELDIPLDPVPCPRPRISKFGAYYPAKYRKWKAQFAQVIRKAWRDEPINGVLSIGIEIVCKRPAKTKLSTPRPDVDNYAKAVLDGCNGIVWGDDTQVIHLRITKRWAPKSEPGKIRMSVAWGTSLAPHAAAGTTLHGTQTATATALAAARTSTAAAICPTCLRPPTAP